MESAYIPTWGVCWEHLRDLLFSREFCLMDPSWVWNQPQFSDLVLYWVSCHLFKYLTDSALARNCQSMRRGRNWRDKRRGFPSPYRYPNIVIAALALFQMFQEMLLMGTLQCFCLENPRDKGAWWAAVYGVTQSWTQLKWLSSSSKLIKCHFFFFWLLLFQLILIISW